MIRSFRNCKNCNSTFVSTDGSVLCKSCESYEEELFQKIKAYLQDHPGTSISILSVELNISVSQINRFIQDGRLIL